MSLLPTARCAALLWQRQTLPLPPAAFWPQFRREKVSIIIISNHSGSSTLWLSSWWDIFVALQMTEEADVWPTNPTEEASVCVVVVADSGWCLASPFVVAACPQWHGWVLFHVVQPHCGWPSSICFISIQSVRDALGVMQSSIEAVVHP